LTLFNNLQQNLARIDDDAWKEREAAVLTIGAIAEGCITGLYPHLPQVIIITNQQCTHNPIEHNSSKNTCHASNLIETIVSDDLRNISFQKYFN
jgi:hypothetical protein